MQPCTRHHAIIPAPPQLRIVMSNGAITPAGICAVHLMPHRTTWIDIYVSFSIHPMDGQNGTIVLAMAGDKIARF